MCRFELRESEIAILEDRFQSAVDPDYVEYLAFSDDVESIFATKHLEKAPLMDVPLFQPPVEWEQNHLDTDAEAMLNRCLGRLAEKVHLVQ